MGNQARGKERKYREAMLLSRGGVDTDAEALGKAHLLLLRFTKVKLTSHECAHHRLPSKETGQQQRRVQMITGMIGQSRGGGIPLADALSREAVEGAGTRRKQVRRRRRR